MKAYYKVGQLVVIKCDSLVYYKVRQLLAKPSQVLQSVTVLLQSGTGITKCDDCCKVRQNIRKSEITESEALNLLYLKEKIQRKPLQLSRFLQVGLVLVGASCGGLIFVCFALNSVEAREGMPVLSFLDENRGNIIGGTTCSCLVCVFLFQLKVHRCSAMFFFFFFLRHKQRRALNFRLDLLTKKGKAGQC